MHALDPDVLRSFIAIADTGGFGSAGDAVNKTQSTVSMQMKRLEDQIGVALFRKEGRRNVLSHDGERLLEYARRLVRLNDEAVQAFRAPELAGAVRIGSPDEYASAFLPDVLARFAQSHPRVEVSVLCETSLSLSQKIAAEELDVALVTCETPKMGAEIVRTEALHWVSSARHRAHLEPLLPLALEQVGCMWRTMMLDALDRAKKPYRHAFTGSNGTGVVAAVNSGFAVTAVPQSMIQPNFRVLTEADGFPPLEAFNIGLLRAASTSENPVANALCDHIKDCLSGGESIARLPGLAA